MGSVDKNVAPETAVEAYSSAMEDCPADLRRARAEGFAQAYAKLYDERNQECRDLRDQLAAKQAELDAYLPTIDEAFQVLFDVKKLDADSITSLMEILRDHMLDDNNDPSFPLGDCSKHEKKVAYDLVRVIQTCEEISHTPESDWPSASEARRVA
jgi:predicted metalloendopeptidase